MLRFKRRPNMLSTLVRSLSDERGGVAVTFSIALIPITIAVGAAVDYSRVSSARTSAQAAADAGALAAAASRSTNKNELSATANRFVTAAVYGEPLLSDAKMTKFSYGDDRVIEVVVEGRIDALIMGLVGIEKLEYKAVAKSFRSTPGTTEVALVLDNTYSMVGEKISSLKAAAIDLVKALKEDPNADVRIAVVPYADYVNVGVQNRGQKWVNVPADYTETSPRVCKTVDEKTTCVATGQPKFCTRYVDGVAETYDCTPKTCTTEKVTPYESCSGGGTRKFIWFGCVGTRTKGMLRRSDAEPETPYPGFLATTQNCLNPIVPLTKSRETVTSALNAMVVSIGSYKPQTYIPAGLVWGVNVLSPSEPFKEGAAYDSKNRKPRKVIVLMTDGENTMRYDPSNGRHYNVSSDPSTAAKQVAETDADMQAICDYAKAQKIELFTVLFGVNNNKAKSRMAQCATSAAHAFEAVSRAELIAAFQNIARSLTNVYLTK